MPSSTFPFLPHVRLTEAASTSAMFVNKTHALTSSGIPEGMPPVTWMFLNLSDHWPHQLGELGGATPKCEKSKLWNVCRGEPGLVPLKPGSSQSTSFPMSCSSATNMLVYQRKLKGLYLPLLRKKLTSARACIWMIERIWNC